MVEDYIEVTGALPTGANYWKLLMGTIQEVLDDLSKNSVTSEKLIYYTDDGTNAEAIVCRRR